MEFDFIHQRPQHLHAPSLDEINFPAVEPFSLQVYRQAVVSGLEAR